MATRRDRRIRRLPVIARQYPELDFTTLARHIDLDWLREAHRRTSKDEALGIDGQTGGQYASKPERFPLPKPWIAPLCPT